LKVASQIKPHEHAALVGGPPSFLIGATLEHTRCWARYRADRSGSTADSNQRTCDHLGITLRDSRLNPATPPIAGARGQCPCYGLSRAVRFVSLAIFLTGVRAFECARNSFSSALLYSRRTRFFTFLATTCS